MGFSMISPTSFQPLLNPSYIQSINELMSYGMSLYKYDLIAKSA
jgi:hypothetical protein